MKYKFLLIIMLELGLMLGSCKDFLEEVPTGSLNVDTKLNSYESALAITNGAYRNLTNWLGAAGGAFANLPMSLEFPTGKAYTYFAPVMLYRYETDAVSGDLDYFTNQWDYWYAGVRVCNLALKMIPDIIGVSVTDRSKFMGEIRTLRAFYYFCLVRYWGDVIYNTGVLTDVNQAARPRSSLKTIYDKIIVPDLEFAVNESNLADAQSTDGHVTKYTARTILADVYLTMAGYPYQEVTDTTIAYCEEGLWTMTDYPVNTTSAKDLLQKAKTQLDVLYGKFLLGNFTDLNKPEMNNKGEAIFQAQFKEGVKNNTIVLYSLPQGKNLAVNTEGGTYVPSPEYINSYNPADKRILDRAYFFYSDNVASKWDPNEPPCSAFPQPFLYKFYDYRCVKVSGLSGLNWTFYRYADVLLMHTEVNWALKQLGVTVTDDDIVKGINEVRTRAGLSTFLGSNLTLKDILSERAYELVYENKMIWDMRRTRKALVDGSGSFLALENFVGHQPTYFNFEFTAKHLLSPVSSKEISNNIFCTQNYGWQPIQIGQ